MALDKIDINHLTTVAIAKGLAAVYAVLIFLIGLWLAKHLAKLVFKLMQLRKVDDTIAKFSKNMVYYILMIFVVIAVLSQLGVQTASLVAAIAGMSIAIGLSLRSSLSNLASGLLLILFRPFKVGDYITVGNYSGTVEEIKILYTQVMTLGRQQVTIPNDTFMSNAVTNFSANSTRRGDIVIGIGYEDDIDKAKELLHDLIEQNNRIFEEPKPLVVVKELADSSVNLLARFHTKTSDYLSVVFEFNEAVKKCFDQEGISIPFPQQDVHIIGSQTSAQEE